MIHIEGMKKMYKIACKKELNSAVTYMEIEAPFVAKKAKAGQFIIFRVDDKSERVPLTIAGYDREKGTVAIIFQKVGLSTELLGSLNEGDYIQDFVGPLGKPTDVEGKKRVCVVGGGNVAMDAARCAKRMGAEKVYIVYRRGEAEMPARLEEQHHAKEEGIEFMTLTNPVEILGGEDGRVNGMKCIKMELGEPDASGRRRPIPVEDSEFVLDVDTVIMSLGTSPNPLIRSTTPGLETNKKGGIIVDENEMSTRENVFAGGDAVTGAATVILAMGAGKKAAEAIDRKLQNK